MTELCPTGQVLSLTVSTRMDVLWCGIASFNLTFFSGWERVAAWEKRLAVMEENLTLPLASLVHPEKGL